MFMLSACSLGSPMAAEGRMEDLASRIARRYPRDLLRAFGKEPIPIQIPVGEGAIGGVELNLGLSLGGCFGVEPGSGGADKRLVRSSSLAAFSIFPFGEYEVPAVNGALARTCSLPTEADEEQRKRKAMQSLKRLEAKRKRLERRNSRVGSDEDVVSGNGSVETKPAMNGLIDGASSSYHGSPKCESRISWRSSSGLSSIDSQALQGLTITTDSKGPSTKPPLPEHDNHKADTNPTAATMPRTLSYAAEENGLTLKADQKANMFVGEADRDMMEEMPSVSTRGDGPNGKKIEGFLYKYKKGEAVRIVCICHGKFHTPAEFVKHAGGSDVAHPLKHIVVNPLPSPGYR